MGCGTGVLAIAAARLGFSDVVAIDREETALTAARANAGLNGVAIDVAPGLRLINLGVHFKGGTVLHWPDGEHGRGALLSGDIVQVIPDRTHVGFMYSYPNLIPERPSVVRRAAELLAEYEFEAIYGAWWDAIVRTDGHEVVQRSAKRYLAYALES